MANNILIIHTDQHRYDCMGVLNDDLETPNIDKLAQDGVLYENSFCSFPICTPSRYSFLSGLYAHEHLGANNHCTLPAGIDTFPEILKEKGYNTKAVGKMHFTPTYLDVGFEEMELAEQNGPGRFDDDYHSYLKENDLIDKIDLMDQVQEYREQAPDEYWESFGALESNLSEEHHSTTWIGDRAVAAVKEWEGNKNLLMAGFIKPHHPFDPPHPWSDMYDPDQLSLVEGWTEKCNPQDLEMGGYFSYDELDEQATRKAMAMYYGSISHIDYQVGRIIDILKQKGMYEETMIVFTSDHGDYLGFHHLLLKGNYMYDPVVKVPLIIKYPQQKQENTISDSLVNNIDLAPTILEEVGYERGTDMKGINIKENNGERKFIFAETPRAEQYMIRSEQYKLILCKTEEKSQFFDLNKDPYELNNLYHDKEYKEKVEEFKKSLTEWILFEKSSLKINHLNEDGPIISGGNVSSGDKKEREEMKSYFRQKGEMKNIGKGEIY
ncbi:MAG: sulfatase-like hydrolase/transferase [bacterium]